MRVKLSYTAEVEDVLKEAANIINLSADDMSQCIALFNETQALLKEKENHPPNTAVALEMIEKYRKSLLGVDTRLSEVAEIIRGYDDYRRSKAAKAAAPIIVDDTADASAPIVDTDYTGELRGGADE